MKFTIYSKAKNRFYPICEVNRINSGLYINSLTNTDDSHFSYHKTGECHHKSSLTSRFPEMQTTKWRPPLANFAGTESVIALNFIMGSPAGDKLRKPKEGDMVFEYDAPFTLEITISDTNIELLPLADRGTLSVLKKIDTRPAIIVEAYELIGNTLSFPRFSQMHPITFGITDKNKRAIVANGTT